MYGISPPNISYMDPRDTGYMYIHRSRYLTIFVKTNGLHGAGHAVETMDAISQSPSLPVMIYLDEIDKLGNYESILT